ncbi:MAG: hypothetical protein R3F59_27050 [Myxococcota bacterium]
MILALALSAGAAPAEVVATCAAVWAQPEPADSYAHRLRAACAPLVPDAACRRAIAGAAPPPGVTAACAAKVNDALAARGAAPDLDPETLGWLVAATFVALDQPLGVTVPPPRPAVEHHVDIRLAADGAAVAADGEPVPCATPCGDDALGEALAAVAARPGWAGATVTVQAAPSVAYVRVVAVLDAVRPHFEEIVFAAE